MKSNLEKKKIALPRFVNYTIGISLISFGMAVMLTARLGMAPTSSSPVTVYEITQLFTAGRWITILNIIFVFASMAVSRKVYVSHALSFVTVVILGLLIDVFEIVLTPFVPELFVVRLIIVLSACVVMSIGVGSYCLVNIRLYLIYIYA